MSTMMSIIIMSVSSNSIMMMWMMIEISNMSFTPMMVTKKLKNSESVMQFVLIQKMSSMIMLFTLMMIMLNNLNYEYILLMSLIMKMGGVPFHNWIIAMIKGMQYNSMFLLFTLMKMPTVIMLSMTNLKMNILILISMLIPTMMMVNENSMKEMLSMSSMFNLGLMLMLMININMWLMYLAIYSIIMKMMMEQLKKTKLNK